MRLLTTALIVALGVATLAAQTKQERAGIVNFTKVDAVVACGGATDTAALDGLAKDGFKAVINLRLPTEAGANLEQNAAHAKEVGMKYISKAMMLTMWVCFQRQNGLFVFAAQRDALLCVCLAFG